MRLLPCPSHNSGSQGLHIFPVSLAPPKIIFSKNFTVKTHFDGGVSMGGIRVIFFDKMSYQGARVKIKSGMVKLLQPCLCLQYLYAQVVVTGGNSIYSLILKVTLVFT